MASLKYFAYRAAFEALWASQLAKIVRALSRSRGVIFTLHRVLPEPPADFSPNAILQVTPQFLEFVILRLRELGLELVGIDEAVRRIQSPEAEAAFAVLSFDDAYRDNLTHALPVLRRRKCPFTLYVPSGFVDGVGQVWWQALEDIIAQQDAIALTDKRGELHYHDTRSLSQKYRLYSRLYARMRENPEQERVKFIAELGARYGLAMQQHCRELIMDWNELNTFVSEPLCTIGAHTVHHYELAKLDRVQARQEIEQCVGVLKAQYGLKVRHLSYPIGARASAGPREFGLAAELGMKTGVTTRPGGLYYRHKDSLMSLPRISLNGFFQKRRYVEVFAAGALFSMLPAN
ncbi:MAG TPA: polysaccharide deacetylase [Devosia sp.]|nr:polysaccharide deacetylase [Devosia sp.]